MMRLPNCAPKAKLEAELINAGKGFVQFSFVIISHVDYGIPSVSH
jgi:hypothetical protein